MGNKLKALYKEAYGNWSVAYLSVWTGFMVWATLGREVPLYSILLLGFTATAMTTIAGFGGYQRGYLAGQREERATGPEHVNTIMRERLAVEESLRTRLLNNNPELRGYPREWM
jgi:hypothetical protein